MTHCKTCGTDYPEGVSECDWCDAEIHIQRVPLLDFNYPDWWPHSIGSHIITRRMTREEFEKEFGT